MDSSETEFQNGDNFWKYYKCIHETGVNVCIKVLNWLYKGQSPLKDLVVDLTKYKGIKTDGTEEKKKLNDLEKGNIGLSDLGLTLLYKITQSVCGLENKKHVWSKDDLEYHLSKLFDGQNNVKKVTELDLKNKCDVQSLLLTKILQKAGQTAINVHAQKIEDDIQKIEVYVQKIKDDVQNMQNDAQKIKADVKKIEDWTVQKIEDDVHKIKKDIKKNQEDVQKIKDDVQKFIDNVQKIIDDFYVKIQTDTNDICSSDKIDASAKYKSFHNKTGSIVFIQILDWLYQGRSTIEDLVVGLTKMKKSGVNRTQKDLLENSSGLSDYDFTFMYEIIQVVCGLANRNDPVWNNHDELEYLLFELKEHRNFLGHPGREAKNITDSDFNSKSAEIKQLLPKIIEKAGLRANIDVQDVSDVIKDIENDIERIRSKDKIDEAEKIRILGLILKEMKSSYEDDMNSSIEMELRGYSAPCLRSQNSITKIPVHDLIIFEEFPVIVVQGEAGEGKTALTRFFFYSWLSGNTGSLKGLSSFDVVLRVECNRIVSCDMNLFYETLFSIASFAFTNTNSLKRSLDEFKIFWIMDGFDESRAEFKDFLKAMTSSLSDKHKILITTRPNAYEDLKSILSESKLSTTSLTLELLQGHNVEKISQSLITDDEKKEIFMDHFHSLEETTKHLLSNPLNLKLYIDLWIEHPELECNNFTSEMLFLKTTYNNLLCLEKRLEGRTSLCNNDLKGNMHNWFYGTLCKQSFLMLMKERYHIVDTEFLEILKKDASCFYLLPSTCLSTFLVKGKVNYWRSDEENEWESNEEYDREIEAENEGEIRYAYHHIIQQFVLASLYLRHFKDYDGESVLSGMKSVEFKTFEFKELLTIYVALFNEDGSLDSDIEEVFSPIQHVISLVDVKRKQRLLYETSVATNFNAKYMEKVSQGIKDIPCLNITNLNKSLRFNAIFSITDLIKFLKFVQPQKFSIDNLKKISWDEDFLSLIDFLIKSKLEIKLERYFYRYEDSPSVKANRKKYVKAIIPGRESEDLDEFYSFCESLSKPENQAFEQLEIWLNIDCHCNFAGCNAVNIVSLPKEIVEITIFGLKWESLFTEKEYFEAFLKFLTKIKGDKTLKFKALHLPFLFIFDADNEPTLFAAFLEKDKRLLEFAHSVSNDSKGRWEKFCVELFFNDVNLNLTDFSGSLDALDLLSNRHSNLKTVSLRIESEDEYFRMLTFLHNNKTSLSEVTLSFCELKQSERKCILDKRRSAYRPISRVFYLLKNIINNKKNYFSIPRKLVYCTSIYMTFNSDEVDFQEFLTFIKHIKGDETLKLKALYLKNGNFTEEQRKMLLYQITSELKEDDSSDDDS